MVENRTAGAQLYRLLNGLLLGAFALLCTLPLVHIFAVSFSDRAASGGGLVTFWPINFTTAAYEAVFSAGTFTNAFWISIQRTVLGTAVNMALTILMAYPLAKTSRELRGRNLFMGLMLFAMLFQGGLIPLFLVVRNLGLLNTIWALILPWGLPIWNVILLMNFFREIPADLEEAAVIDGASHWHLLWHVYLPLSLPALATLTLFCAVGHWNSWFDGMVFMKDENYPLQTFLRTVVIDMNMTRLVHDVRELAQASDRSVRAAQIIVTTLPILVVYPFLQRYFISGIRLGAVKG